MGHSPRKFADRVGPVAPVEEVLVSGLIGTDTQIGKLNTQALAALFHGGFHAIKGNGDGGFSLTDLEEKIVKAGDAFVFLPIPSTIGQLKADVSKHFFQEMFKAASLFVGAQTKDPLLRLNPDDKLSPLKPMILINHNQCWEPFRELVNHMHELGTIVQDPKSIFHFVDTIQQAVEILKTAHEAKIEPPKPSHHPHKPAKKGGQFGVGDDFEERRKPDFNVCVFCSASTKNKELINISKKIGGDIAKQGWGLISGLGRTGMMGGVCEGAAAVIAEQKARMAEQPGGPLGWVAGSNLPRIIDMEGLPAYYDKIWLKEDIYKRMEVMIDNSQAFVIMPGGMGTVQELMTLLLLKHNPKKDEPYLMRDDKFANKPIIVVNHALTMPDGSKVKFWDPLVKMAKNFGFQNDIVVVDDVQQAVSQLRKHHQEHSHRL